jgi:hypothetical protein
LTPATTEQIWLVIGPPPDAGHVTNRGTDAAESEQVSRKSPPADPGSDKEFRLTPAD